MPQGHNYSKGRQQTYGMEGEPVHQTRRGVEPRPPENGKQENEATQQQLNRRQSKTRRREQIT